MTRPAIDQDNESGAELPAASDADAEMAVRDLRKLAPDDIRGYADPPTRLLDLVGAPAFETVKAYFSDYPERGLSSPTGRSLMFHIVRAMRPELVIEVGTYYAGMTEIIARALWENGAGRIVTIDPYGGARVPGLLNAWPAELRHYVSFADFSSMDLYIDFELTKRRFDLAFIDGNHAYEFAFYDLISLAKWVRPGGVIIVDDYNQPGVFGAVKDFLKLNPGWRELSGAIQEWRSSNPFDSIRASVEGSNFLILAAPRHLELRDSPTSFETQKFSEPCLSGFELRLPPGNARGFLHAMIYLRSFPQANSTATQEQLSATMRIMLDADMDRCVIRLPEALRTSLDPATSYRSAEICLSWQCLDGEQPLQLRDDPTPVLLS